MAVAWNGTAQGALRNELLKNEKVYFARAGHGTRMGIQTYTKSLRINA